MIGLLLAPLLLGVINKTKALFAGRRGPPLLQAYFDLIKLLRKGAVYSRTTTWVFRAGPIVGLAAVIMALAIVPFGGWAPISFGGDFLVLAALLAVMRFFLVAAALDTGSAFEGMGASREVQFSALAEPALLLCLAALARQTDAMSLSGMTAAPLTVEALVTAALAVVFLAENSRIPVDDPNTHLELTMVHEVMVLDHGGPDLAFILYGASLKLWVLGSVLLLPIRSPWVALGGMFGLAVATGVVESTIARLRLLRVPQLLVGASVLAALALMLVLR
ncbi:MAG: hydrogenase [Candidatus Handelsmanbacteria bacterium RIFCSPLOWO2_12_FULL_64_10]|uniref:Hydrogenase n=1 Tax=Handelsmanbacteria sp. (strain RIFCSPLOWO2_12_FULL_64_10) TaxID=1817868 RepID=A0A1F6D7B6_HANXR|nr:MAG: hydrogenase [Candidatus Handelsmanbacteria bacterium RIFCSPLOWO2_12_FULL_64_10]